MAATVLWCALSLAQAAVDILEHRPIVPYAGCDIDSRPSAAISVGDGE
jgi:hypothetical protein